MGRPNYAEVVVRRKLGALPENWAICGWTRIDPDATVYRGGPYRLLTRGKNKGHKRWDNVTHTCVVTDAEEQTERLSHEAETGNCSTCAGTGQEWYGWHHIDGEKYRQCGRCAGSGKAPNVEGNLLPERAARREPASVACRQSG